MDYNNDYHCFLMARLNALNWEELQRRFYVDQRNFLMQQVALVDSQLMVKNSAIEGLHKMVVTFFFGKVTLPLIIHRKSRT